MYQLHMCIHLNVTVHYHLSYVKYFSFLILSYDKHIYLLDTKSAREISQALYDG